MTRFSVLFGTAVLLLAIAAMSAGGSGIRDVIDPELTDEVEGLVGRSALREFAGLERTPIPAATSVPVDGGPVGGSAHVGAPFVEIPLVVEDGHAPLTDLDALYGVYGYGPVVPAPAHAAPPVDLVDDTPAMIASAWSNPPLDAK